MFFRKGSESRSEFDASSAEQGHIYYTVSGSVFEESTSSSYIEMGANEDWTIKIETKAALGATVGHTADLSIAIDVLA